METGKEFLSPGVWLQRLLRKSAAFEKIFFRERRIDDTCGWGRLLSGALKYGEDIPSGFLLSGPRGSGRHSSAKIAARSLIEEEENGLGFVCLTGTLLSEKISAETDVLDRIEALMEYFSSDDSEKGPCFLIEKMESCACRADVEDLLALRIGEFREWEIPVFAFYIADNEKDVSAILRAELRSCVLNLPDVAMRLDFLQNQAEDIEGKLFGIGLDLKKIAEKTEGFNFTQMRDLVYFVGLWIEKYGEITAGDFHHLLRSQQSRETDGELRRHFMKKMISFFENPAFPAMNVSQTRSAQQVYTVQQAAAQNSQAKPGFSETFNAQELYKQLEEMPVKDLMDDFLGKEAFEEIRNSMNKEG